MSSFHIGQVHVKSDSREKFLASLEMLKKMPGFVNNTVYVSDEDANVLTTVEEWRSAEDHANFLASLPEGALQEWISMLEKPPVSAFFTKM